MEDFSELSFVNKFLGKGDSWHTAIVVPDHVGDTCPLDRLAHLLALSGVHGERFFAEYDLARIGRGQGNFFMQVVGDANVNGVDIIAFEKPSPICFDAFVSPGIREVLRIFGGSSTDSL